MANVTCEKCGQENPAGAKFCTGCGQPLSSGDFTVCRQCGTTVAAESRFCTVCGKPLPVKASGERVAQVEAELSHLAFLDQELEPDVARGNLHLVDRTARRWLSDWARTRRVQLLRELARLHRELGEPAAALRFCRLALRLDPWDADTLLELGDAQRAIGEHAQAEQAYLRALVAHPDWNTAHLALGALYESQGNLASAAVHFHAAKAVTELARVNAQLQAPAQAQPATVPAPVRETSDHLEYLLAQLQQSVQQGHLTLSDYKLLEEDYNRRLNVLATGTEGAAVAAAPAAPAAQVARTAPPSPVRRRAEVAPPIPARPARPPREPIQWGRVMEGLFSERTLRVVLSLGGLFVVLAALIQVAVNWERFSPVVQILVLMGATAAMYAAGAALRKRPGYLMTAQVFVYLGGLLVPLDAFAVTRPEFLGLTRQGSWLLVSAVALPVYFAMSRLLRDRLSAYLSTLSLGSLLLAALTVAGLALEWRVTLLVGLAMAYLLGWRALEGKAAWAPMREALFWVSQSGALFFAIVAIVLAQEGVIGGTGAAVASASAAATLWVASAYYGLYTWATRKAWSECAALLVLAVAFFFSLHAFRVPVVWYGSALAAMGCVYLLYGRLARRRAFSGRLWSQGTVSNEALAWLANSPSYILAYVAVAASLVWPHAGASRVVSLYAASGAFALSAVLFRVEAWSYLALVGFFGSVWYTMYYFGMGAGYQNLVFEAMALLFLAVGTQMARGRAGRTSDASSAMGLLAGLRVASARPFIIAAYLTIAVALVKTTADLYAWPGQQAVAEVSYIFLTVILGLSAYLWRSSAFVYLAGVLFLWPFWLAGQVNFHTSTRYVHDYLPLYFAVLSAPYIGLGLLLRRAKTDYVRPLHLVGYLLTLLGLVLAIVQPAVMLRTLLVVVPVYGFSAWLVHTGRHPSFQWLVGRLFRHSDRLEHRVARSIFVYLAAWLGAGLAVLAMSTFGVRLEYQGLVLGLMGPAYVAVGLYARRAYDAYGHPFYVMGYFLAGVGVLLAFPSFPLRAITLTIAVALAAASARIFRQAAWLYVVAALVPLLEAVFFRLFNMPPRFVGLGLLGLVPAYGAVGLGLGVGWRLRLRYRDQAIGPTGLPFLAGAYVLTAVALAISGAQGGPIAIVSFALGGAVYAASAFVLGQPVFLYAAAGVLVVPYYMVVTYIPRLPFSFFGLAMMPLVVLYLLVALRLGGRRAMSLRALFVPGGLTRALGSPAAPFYIAAYLGTLGIPMVWIQDAVALSAVLAADALIYFVSARLTRNNLWLYPGAAALVVAYYLGLTQQSAIPFSFFGLAMMPLVVLYLAAGWRLTGGRPPSLAQMTDGTRFRAALGSAAMPFYLAAYLGTVAIPVIWTQDAKALSASLGAGALIYLYSAWLFRSSGWLYLALVAAHLGYVAGAADLGYQLASARLAYLFVPAAFLMLGIAYLVNRRARGRQDSRSVAVPGIARLHTWALPFGLMALVDVVVATYAGQFETWPGVTVGVAFFGLFALFSYLWRSEALIWAGMAFFGLGYIHILNLAGVLRGNSVAYTSILALALANAAFLLRQALKGVRQGPLAPLRLWVRPMKWSALALSGVAFLPFFVFLGPDGFGRSQGLHLALAFLALGAMYLSVSAWERVVRMAYVGLALGGAALSTLLAVNKFYELQAYLIPWGVYVALVGLGERYMGNRRLGRYLEMVGLGGMLVVTQLQLFGLLGPVSIAKQQRLWQLIFVESIAVSVQGGLRRIRMPFFTGVGFLLLNIFLAVFDTMRGRGTAGLLYLLLVLGIILIGMGVFIERRREQFRQRARQLLEALDRWE